MTSRRVMLTALVAAVGLLVGCDAVIRVDGRVIDAAGRPVPGAAVYVKSSSGAKSDLQQTKADGAYGIVFIHGSDWVTVTVVAEKSGYQPASIAIRATGASVTSDLGLREP